MLFWSPKLREKLNLLSEKSDDEIAADDDKKIEEENCAELNLEEWGVVISRNARAELLAWAAQYGGEGVARFLEELRMRPRSHAGLFLDFQQKRLI